MKRIADSTTTGRLALVLVAIVSAYFCRRADLGYAPAAVFYVTLIVFTASVWMLVPAWLVSKVPGLATAGRTLIVLVVLLPAADFAYVNLQTKVVASTKPVYSYEAAKGNPTAFHAWWEYYAKEWTRPNGFKASTEMPDPQGVLPFVTIPNSSAGFFGSVLHIDNFGFRGKDIERDKGNRFRIFALGESATLGPTIHQGERPWPAVLQALFDSRLACSRPIEVINAGTEFYTLKDNIERVRRSIIPLQPDIVISYHGYNGLRAGLLDRTVAVKSSQGKPRPKARKRPSALIQAVRDKLYIWKRKRSLQKSYSDEKIMHGRYADLYRELIRLGNEHHFEVVLANSSMAVNASSPPKVRDFYGSVFREIDLVIAQNAAHNRMVKKIAEAAGVPFIDTTPGLDGIWDKDLYLDLVHFTQKGNNLIAKTMFDALVRILRGDENLRCVEH